MERDLFRFLNRQVSWEVFLSSLPSGDKDNLAGVASWLQKKIGPRGEVFAVGSSAVRARRLARGKRLRERQTPNDYDLRVRVRRGTANQEMSDRLSVAFREDPPAGFRVIAEKGMDAKGYPRETRRLYPDKGKTIHVILPRNGDWSPEEEIWYAKRGLTSPLARLSTPS